VVAAHPLRLEALAHEPVGAQGGLIEQPARKSAKAAGSVVVVHRASLAEKPLVVPTIVDIVGDTND
jgi:hypothetical protein